MDALTYANSLTIDVHSDWRLPNVTELESLINAEEADSAVWLNLPAQGFSSVQAGYYWSATTYAPFTTDAWRVYMGNGKVSISAKTNSNYVLAVRSGQ